MGDVHQRVVSLCIPTLVDVMFTSDGHLILLAVQGKVRRHPFGIGVGVHASGAV